MTTNPAATDATKNSTQNAMPSSPEAVGTKEFAPGCELWIICSPAQSAWARRVDWSLNSQIMKAELHRPQELAPTLQSILEDGEFPIFQVPREPGTEAGTSQAPFEPTLPLMVASRSLLPNQTTVVLPFASDLKTWVHACHGLWVRLNRPRARIFLPDGQAPGAFRPEDFLKAWPTADATAPLEIVGAN